MDSGDTVLLVDMMKPRMKEAGVYMEIKIFEEQPTEKNPYMVENYPYGFRFRTKARFWVETTRYGQRFCRQTLNPQTNRWNKPKKSTYSQIVLAGLNEEEHVKWTGISLYSTDRAIKFKEKYWDFMSDYQKKEITNIIKMSEVLDKVEYTFRTRKYKHKVTGEITESVPIFNMNDYIEVDDDGNPLDREKEDREQEENNRKINSAAISNAANSTDIESALDTFKRVK